MSPRYDLDPVARALFLRGRMGGMTHRIRFLRILSEIDQAMAKIDDTLDGENVSDDELDRMIDVIAELRVQEIQAHAALKML